MKISVVGMGPGSEKKMTLEAMDALEECDAIAGYSVYVNLIKDRFPGKEIITTPMRREEERCRLAVEAALSGQTCGYGVQRGRWGIWHGGADL